MRLRHQLERQGKSAFACLMLPGMLLSALQGNASLISVQGIRAGMGGVGKYRSPVFKQAIQRSSKVDETFHDCRPGDQDAY